MSSGAPGEIVAALEPLIDALERLGVPYQVGGSVASSLHGVSRSTLDVDLVADLKRAHVGPLAEALAEEYYVDEDAVRDAVRRRASFNVIHYATVLKVDVFVLRARPFDRSAFARAVQDTLPDDTGRSRHFSFASPEDVILHKLEWYRLGHHVSERQWLDVLGVLKVQGQRLDRAYLAHWAKDLGLSELLERALREAGVSGAT